jgi:transcriptional antiterminator NusG
MKTNEMKWYVVKTISGKEEKVKQYIERELELNKMSKFVSQILIPTEKVYHGDIFGDPSLFQDFGGFD